MRLNLTCILSLFFLITQIEHGNASKEEVYINKGNEKEITLIGLLNLIYYYGPPNYGESPEEDRIEGAYILTLEKPIDFEDAEGDHTKSHLLHIYGDIKNEFIGKTVEIKAKSNSFFTAVTGHHRAKLVAKLSSIKIFEKGLPIKPHIN